MQTAQTTYRIFDTFNHREVSRHRSLRMAAIASDKYSRAVRRRNGSSAYLPTRIEYLAGGEWVAAPAEDGIDAERQSIGH